MKRIGSIIICLLTFGLVTLTVPNYVEAAQCGEGHGDCAGGWYCVDGQCLQDSGCWVNVCDPPNTCNGDICMPAGGSECPCGTNASGACKSCGGGGAYGYPQCGSGTTLQCGNPTLFLAGGGGLTNDSNLAQCVHRGLCGDSYFPSYHEATGCDGQEVKGICVDNCQCCAIGTTLQKTTTQGGTYSREISCFSSSAHQYCNDWDDQFISRSYGAGAGNCYCDCPNEEDGCGRNCGRGGTWIRNDIVTCRTVNTSWSCVATCTATGPSNIAVTQGSSGSSATVSWTPGTGGTVQRLYVDQSATEVGNNCPTANACEVKAESLLNSTNSYVVSGLQNDTTYYFRVVTYKDASCWRASVATYRTPNLTLAGRVYLDSLNNCSTTTPWNLGGLTVSVRGTAYSTSVGSDGRFAMYGGTTNPISYLDLTGFGSAYTPSTATGCNQGATLTSVANPSTTNYFYLTPLREAWWQVIGGSAYANGNVRSELPSASARLITPELGGEVGALMRASGVVDVGAGAVSDPGYSAQTRYKGKTMDFAYFAAHMGVTPSTENDWAADTMNKPTNNPDRTFYYLDPTSQEASVSTPWTVAAGESYVVFVDGDLRIASPVTVAEGGFLAFIVNGSIRVSPAISEIQGLYVADGAIITESNGGVDVAAEFEGSMVAWGGFNMGRDLVANNVGTPGESFRYRPDLLLNMPDAMKIFALRWEEVVPGTFSQ